MCCENREGEYKDDMKIERRNNGMGSFKWDEGSKGVRKELTKVKHLWKHHMEKYIC